MEWERKREESSLSDEMQKVLSDRRAAQAEAAKLQESLEDATGRIDEMTDRMASLEDELENANISREFPVCEPSHPKKALFFMVAVGR